MNVVSEKGTKKIDNIATETFGMEKLKMLIGLQRRTQTKTLKENLLRPVTTIERRRINGNYSPGSSLEEDYISDP